MSYAQTAHPSAGTEWALSMSLRRVLLLAPPLALAVLEYFHPAPEVNADAVMEVATWFAVFHAIQLVLIGLVGVSVLLLADSFGVAASWTIRVGIGVFLVVYSAYDAIAGISTGLAMRTARDLPAAQQEGVWVAVKDWPAFDPAVFSLNIVGTLGWVVAVGALALVVRRQGAPRSRWILIGLAALFLLAGHPFPGGTFAFASLFVAAALVVSGESRGREQLRAAARELRDAEDTGGIDARSDVARHTVPADAGRRATTK